MPINNGGKTSEIIAHNKTKHHAFYPDTMSNTASQPLASRPQTSINVHITPLAISIISNNRLLREGLLRLISEYMEVLLVGCYTVDPDSMTLLPNPVGHIVILDGSIGAEAGQSWLRYWRGLTPLPDTLVLELPNERKVIVDYIECGASGYALQGASTVEVVATIRQILGKTIYCSPEVTAELCARLASLKAAVVPLPAKLPLTAREFEVLRLIADGLSNQDIADRLVIDVRTVKHHVHNILQKLALSHRWDAARLAIERGWLPHTAASSG